MHCPPVLLAEGSCEPRLAHFTELAGGSSPQATIPTTHGGNPLVQRPRKALSRLSCCSCSFQVDIRFPQSGALDPNCVTVTGLPENVEEAIDHILNLEEEYVSPGPGRSCTAGGGPAAGQHGGGALAHPCCPLTPPCPQLADVVDSEALQVHMKPPVREEPKAPSKGFVVRDAPWTAGNEKVSCRLSWARDRQTRPPSGGPCARVATPVLKLCLVSPQAPDMSSSEEFPSFGAQVAPKTLPWGPKR